MGLLRKFFSNTGKPQGTMGKIVVAMMNRVHAGIAAWGFSHLDLQGSEQVLDCGCGGGANIAVFLRMVDEGRVRSTMRRLRRDAVKSCREMCRNCRLMTVSSML